MLTPEGKQGHTLGDFVEFHGHKVFLASYMKSYHNQLAFITTTSMYPLCNSVQKNEAFQY